MEVTDQMRRYKTKENLLKRENGFIWFCLFFCLFHFLLINETVLFTALHYKVGTKYWALKSFDQKNFYLKSFIKLQLIFTFLDEVNHQNLPVCVCFKYMLMLVKIRSKKGPEISFPNRQILRVSGTLVKVIWVSAALLISIYMVFIFKICHP